MTANDPARENTEAELQEVGGVSKNLKKEQTATRRGTKAGHSSRQERDKPEMGGRLAYIKERSRKKAEKHRLSTQQERTEKNLHTQLTWARRFDQPGAGRKEKVFPLPEKELKDEKAVAPLFRHARSALLEEDPQEELPEPRARTRELPPSEVKVTAAKKAKKHRKERKREKRRKAEKAEKAKGRPAVGNLSAFGGNTETGSKGATDQYPGWTRVDFVVDSGASATTLPRKLLVKLEAEGTGWVPQLPTCRRQRGCQRGHARSQSLAAGRRGPPSPRSPSHFCQWAKSPPEETR